MRAEFYVALLIILLPDESKVFSIVDFDITIEPGPAYGVFLPGSTARVDCVAHCSDNTSCIVTWYFNGFQIQPSEKHVFLHNGSLQITGFNASDGGEYACVVISKRYARMSKFAVLQLAVIQNETQDVVDEYVTVGNNVLLPCSVEGEPKPRVVWTKHSFDNLTERVVMNVVPQTNSLLLINVTMEDEGLYKCHASNIAGRAVAAMFAVNVSGDPRPVRQINRVRAVHAMLDAPLTLECPWSYSDSVWYRGHFKIGSNFSVGSVTFGDAGIFTCKSSKDPLLSMDVNLTVYAAPLLLSRRLVRSRVRNGSEVSLTSVYVGNPIPEAKWYRDGRELLQESSGKSRMKIFVKNHTGFAQQSQMVISNYTFWDFGVYQCLIRNPYGVVEATYFFYVFETVGPVQNVTARLVGNGEVEVSWEPPSELRGPPLYSVFYWSERDPSEKWRNTNGTRMTLVGLRSATNYTFHVRAYVFGEIGDPSNFVSLMTEDEESAVPLLLPHVTLVVENLTTVTVSWTKLSREASGFIIGHKVVLKCFEDSEIKTFPVHGSAYNFTLTNLKPETRYDVAVLSGNSVGYPNVEDFEDLEHRISPWKAIFLRENELGESTLTSYLNDEIVELALESSSSTEGSEAQESSISTEDPRTDKNSSSTINLKTQESLSSTENLKEQEILSSTEGLKSPSSTVSIKAQESSTSTESPKDREILISTEGLESRISLNNIENLESQESSNSTESLKAQEVLSNTEDAKFQIRLNSTVNLKDQGNLNSTKTPNAEEILSITESSISQKTSSSTVNLKDQESSSSAKNAKAQEMTSSAENINLKTTTKRKRLRSTKRKGSDLHGTEASKRPQTDNDLDASIQAMAVNDTTILVSLSDSLNIDYMEYVSICYGADIFRAMPQCKQWMNWGDLSRNKMYVTDLMPITKYYFRVYDDRQWLTDVISCWTDLPIPIGLKYFITNNSALVVTWSIPETMQTNFMFRVSYVSYLDSLRFSWSHGLVEGSTMSYTIEKYENDWDYAIEVNSVMGDVVSDRSGVLHVKAQRGGILQYLPPDVSSIKIFFVTMVVIATVAIVIVVVFYVVAITRRHRGFWEPDSSPATREAIAVVSASSPRVSLELKRIDRDGSRQQRST